MIFDMSWTFSSLELTFLVRWRVQSDRSVITLIDSQMARTLCRDAGQTLQSRSQLL
jgi:hypothetical protein